MNTTTPPRPFAVTPSLTARNRPDRPVVRCDVCGERPWEFICRVSNRSNRLLNERRYCLVCAQESGEVVL